MSLVFISYAREQLPIAEQLTYALRNEGHTVFFAEAELRGGEGYGSAIRRHIQACDLFVFLISPESVSARYPLTELELFQKEEPAPGKRILPVMAVPVPINSVPNYLRPLTILSPKGDLVAESLNRIAEISAERQRKRLLLAAALLVLVAVAGVSIWWVVRRHRDQAKPPAQVTLAKSLSVFHDPDQSSEIVGQFKPGDELTVTPMSGNPNWVAVHTRTQDGWAMAQDITAQDTGGGGTIALGQGFGYKGDYWNLFFTSPQKEGRPPNQFGIDMRFADAIGRTQKSLDIAVYEFNNKTITDAILEAHQRGVKVRVVTGQFGYKEPDASFGQLEKAGIPVVVRPDENDFMHNKFAILDGKTVWTGSWNYTDGATYRNNENAVVLTGDDFAQRYEGVFNQMFEGQRFGVARKPAPPVPTLSHGVQVMFAPEDPIVPELLKRIRSARRSITFMAFSLTLDEVTQAIIEQSQHMSVRGILEPKMARGSAASKALCAPPSKVELRFGSSPHFLHHDVFVIDDELVITGSANFVHHGTEVNDENIVFIPDPLLAKKYDAEFSRLWTKGAVPDAAFCTPQPATGN